MLLPVILLLSTFIVSINLTILSSMNLYILHTTPVYLIKSGTDLTDSNGVIAFGLA